MLPAASTTERSTLNCWLLGEPKAVIVAWMMHGSWMSCLESGGRWVVMFKVVACLIIYYSIIQLQVQWSSAPVVGYIMGCPHSCKRNRSAHICLIGLATVCQFCGMWLQMWEHVELCITTGQSHHHYKLPCMLIYLEATVLCRELPTLSLLFFSFFANIMTSETISEQFFGKSLNNDGLG